MIEVATKQLIHPKIQPFLSKGLAPVIKESDAAIIVDDQNDFADKEGALYVKGAQEIQESIVRFTLRFKEKNRIPTGDWHDENDRSFLKNGGPWPRHCVKFTWGAKLYKLLTTVELADPILKSQDIDIESYGAAFDDQGKSNGLVERLRNLKVTSCYVYGLVYNFCAGYTALQLAQAGFYVYLVVDLTKAIEGVKEVNTGRESIDVMTEKLVEAGVVFVTSDQVI